MFAVRCCLLGLLLFAISGCGPKTARLTGKVTLGGQPVPNAEIEIAPVGDQSKNYRGLSLANGDYQIDYGPAGGLPLGEYRVTVSVYVTKAGALLPEGEAGAVLKNSGQAVARPYELSLVVDKAAQVDLNLDTAKPSGS